MSTYALVEGGAVKELFTTTTPIATLFPPAMTWVDVTATPSVQIGWVQVPGGGFTAPSPQTPTVPPVTLAGLQAQLTAIQAQLNQLAGSGGTGG